MQKNPFSFFKDLIAFDQELASLQESCQLFSKTFSDMQTEHSLLEKNRDQALKKMQQAHADLQYKEKTIAEFDDTVRMLQHKLDSASDERIYRSLKTEIAHCKAEQYGYEDIVLAADAVYQNALKQYQLEESKVADHALLMERERLLMEAQKKSWQEKMITAQELRKEKEQLVPEAWLIKYKRLQGTVKNPVVKVVDGACNACFNSLLPHDTKALMHYAMIECRGCFRLLYLDAE